MADIGSLIRHDYNEVDKREELRSVVGWLTGDSKSKVPIIVDGGRPYGIMTDRALIKRRLEERAKVENYTLPTGALPFNATLDQASKRMAEHRASYLPVHDDQEKTAGYVRAIDVARANNMKPKAGEVCLPVPALSDGQTMGEAVNTFHSEYIDVLPVLNNDGRIIGTLPRRAVLSMELNVGHKGRKDAGGEKIHLLNEPIGGFMDTTPPPFMAPTAEFGGVLDMLEDRGYTFVGERDGRIVGIVTPETLFRA